MASPGKGLGGLPPRRPDQANVAPPTAVSPGSSNVVRARLVIITGANDGLFTYNAAGALIASIASAAGTDPLDGDAVPEGVAAYNGTYYVLLGNSPFTTAMQLIFQNIANPFEQAPFVEAFGSGSAGSTLEINSGSGSGGGASGIICQDSTAAGRANGSVTIVSGGLSGQALLSDNTFQGPLSLPLPNQTTANNTISTTAGSLSTADRNTINDLVNAVNNLQTNLQASGLELT
jgi:hypothetical protein